MKLDTGTWIVIADGEKYLVAENHGTRAKTRLRVVTHDEIDNPPTREQGSDRPGRRPDASAHAMSAMEETDWHRVARERFAQELAERLRGWAAQGRFAHLVIVAAPRTLGDLRAGYDAAIRACLVAEIGKDLSNQPLSRIEAALNAIE